MVAIGGVMSSPRRATDDTIAVVVDALFEQAGFAIERSVLGRETVERCREEADRLFDDEVLTAPGSGRNRTRGSLSGETVVDRLDPVCDVSPWFDGLAHDPTLIDMADRYVGEPTRLFKDKIITKPPETAGYGLHQDYMRWQDFASADEMVTLGVCLDEATTHSGALEVYVGQHDRLLTPPGVVADPTPDAVNESMTEIVELDPGDVVVLHPLIPHQSDYNRSRQPRRMLYFTYAVARYGDLRPAYYEHHAELFGHRVPPTDLRRPPAPALASRGR
jgi:ectoine hydroxylase-related dioxygenase (phytanoyl-CoA dioxygenase family)